MAGIFTDAEGTNKIYASKIAVIFAAVIALFAMASHARQFEPPAAGAPNDFPKEYQNIGIDEKLGASINPRLKFKDESGNETSLQAVLNEGKPVVLSLAYFECPNLCSIHLNGLNNAFRQLKDPVGREFNFVAISIDPREQPSLARAKKESYVQAYGRPEAASGWHFWVGDEKSIRSLANEVGFKYRWDENEQQYAHASAAIVITPEGRISRYLHGVAFDPRTLQLAILEASNGKIGSIVDRVVLYCFHYDPKESKYVLAATQVMKAGGLATVAMMATFFISFWWRNYRRNSGHISGRNDSSKDEAS